MSEASLPVGVLICIGGPSASGKTTAGLRLLGLCEERAFLIDPDVTRNEVLGRPSHYPLADADMTSKITSRTINRMLDKTEDALANGYIVIVPSSFVLKPMRDGFESMAEELNAPLYGFWLACDDNAILDARRKERRARFDNGERNPTTLSALLTRPNRRMEPGEIHWKIVDATKPKEFVLDSLTGHLSDKAALPFRRNNSSDGIPSSGNTPEVN